jgi:hypothetical protein
MARIMFTENFGNAPKQLFALDFLTAAANGALDQALPMVTDDVQIEIVGQESLAARVADMS